MKKKLLSLFLAVGVLLSACSAESGSPALSAVTTADKPAEPIPSEETAAAEDEPKAPTLAETAGALSETAQALGEEMANGDFSDCAARFSAAMRESLDEAALKAAWDGVVAGAGEYRGVYDLSESERDGAVTVAVTLEYANTGVLATFVFNEEGEIDGLWLNYRVLPEPTEDMEDRAYTEIAVAVGEYRLDGLLTLPKGAERPPVVVFIQGSGQSDLDETVGGARPFRDLAHGLAARGIASIRFNKRFYQYPALADDPTSVTIETEVLADVRAAIALARADERVGDQIFLLGHSLGGMLAPALAAEDGEIRGVISLAGSPRRLEDIIVSQYKAALGESGLDPSDETFAAAMSTVVAEAARIKTLGEDDTGDYFGANAAYWRSLNEIDGAGAALSLECPLLFLQGSEDVQVYADLDYAEWETLLAGKENCRFRLFEGLGHFFTDESGSVDPTVADEIAEFILNERESTLP
ncbi:MAG: alpha/beta fold hydrolase [Bacteroides sp.]|nr:alpha/beta fold hydrolase [Eubacterium sp.]MCM1417513.1 alpha/beta fold hydrolase [Roseburia sp.]MCM1462548.1 alpha/beta fold hydrolase [Bacteroides sp.]